MENLSNSVDFSDWLMPGETVKSEQTVQYDATAKWADFIGNEHEQNKPMYRSSMFVNLKLTTTTSPKGPETICGSTSDGFPTSNNLGSSETYCDTWDRYRHDDDLSKWLLPCEASRENDCDTALDLETDLRPWLMDSEKIRQDTNCGSTCDGFECSGPIQDSYERERDSEWFSMENAEYSIAYNEWLAPQTDSACIITPDKSDDWKNDYECSGSVITNFEIQPDLFRWLAPIETIDSMEGRGYEQETSVDSPWLSPVEKVQTKDQSDQVRGQTIFGDNLEQPKWQSTPLISTGLYAESSLHVESLEREIKDLKDALSIKNEAFLSLENDFETLLNKLDASEQKCKKSESKASNTIELANGEIEIANNYIEMLKKQLLEKDERIHSLQKALTLSKPKRSKMSAQSVKEKSPKVKVHESCLNKGATASPSGGESGLEMSHTLSDGISVSDKQDGPALSKSDTDLNASCNDHGKPAVKIKHSSFSSYLDKKRETDTDKLSQIRYYIEEATHMMEGLKKSSDPSDLERAKKLEQVIQHLHENRSVLEGATSMKD